VFFDVLYIRAGKIILATVVVFILLFDKQLLFMSTVLECANCFVIIGTLSLSIFFNICI